MGKATVIFIFILLAWAFGAWGGNDSIVERLMEESTTTDLGRRPGRPLTEAELEAIYWQSRAHQAEAEARFQENQRLQERYNPPTKFHHLERR